MDGYESLESGGITIYVARELAGKTIRIDRAGFWIFSYLAVSVR